MDAAAAIASVDLGARIKSALEKFLVLKTLGVAEGSPQTLTAQDVLSACNRLFGVSGRRPYNWYDPITDKWSKDQPNGGWPVGTVWTQILRPSATLMRITSVQLTGAGQAQVSFTDDYLSHLRADLGGGTLPTADSAIWFMRDRDDLEPPVFTDVLFTAFALELRLSKDEIAVIFGGLTDRIEVESETAAGAQILGMLLPKEDDAAEAVTAEPVSDHEVNDDNYEWTRTYASMPLPDADVRSLVERTQDLVDQSNLILPDADSLIERCVVGLLTGHLILQGPPGTGKTTLARLLAKAFGAVCDLRTATADWTTYDVIGGLRPTPDDVLEPILGCVPESVLGCAHLVRQVSNGEREADAIARWLIIDEFNRADIDRAIGGLYTVFSSTDTAHLSKNPIELWFEAAERRRLWVPGRFRLIATMNDVDTSFVNALSQGLTRRFQFVYVGVPGIKQLSAESEFARRQAQEWYEAQYGKSFESVTTTADFDKATERVSVILEGLTSWLRYSEQDGKKLLGWPLGTAQIVDLWKTICLHVFSNSDTSEAQLLRAFDLSFADRVVPQMGTLRTSQLAAFAGYLRTNHPSLTESARAVEHLTNPQSVR